MLSRRKFLTAAVGLIAAPAIVRVSSLMPVKSFLPLEGYELGSFLTPEMVAREAISILMRQVEQTVADMKATSGLPKHLFDPEFRMIATETYDIYGTDARA